MMHAQRESTPDSLSAGALSARPCKRPAHAAPIGFALCLIAILCAGCYDGKVLVEEVRSAALRTRLAEVDLGTFRTTLPRNAASNSTTELELHVFGTAPRYRVPAIERQLKSAEYRIRHETLAAVRQVSQEELTEPNLTQLRARIEAVVNEILESAPIKTIGFYDVRVLRS